MNISPPERYLARLVEVHNGLSLGNLPDALSGPPVLSRQGPDGSITVTFLGAQAPARYRHLILGYRLAQLAARGWVDVTLLHDLGIAAEPDRAVDRDYHTVVLDRRTGRVRAYATLCAYRGTSADRLDDVERPRFVIERDYGLNLAEEIPGARPAQLWEGKRLIRSHGLLPSEGGSKAAWWALLGWLASVRHVMAEHGAVAVIGDGKPNQSIASLKSLGLSLRVIDRRALRPSSADLLGPIWDQEVESRPFVVSSIAAAKFDRLDAVLAEQDGRSVRHLLTDTKEP
jgi:hypothetical protein